MLNKANLGDLIAATGLVNLLKLDPNRQFVSMCELEIWWMTSENYRAPIPHYIVQALCIISNPSVNWNWGYSSETLNSSQKSAIFVPCAIETWLMTLKTIGHPFYATLSFVHHFKPSVNSNWSYSPVRPNSGQNQRLILSRVTLKFDRWPWKTIGHLFYTTCTLSFVHHFVVIGEFKLELQSGNAQFWSKLAILLPRDLEIWRMTLKNNMTTLLSNIRLCAWFHRHMWMTEVTVRKRLNWLLASVTLTLTSELDLLHGHQVCHW